MNFIENNLFNQIKMSKKFVWNLKTLSVSSLSWLQLVRQ